MKILPTLLLAFLAPAPALPCQQVVYYPDHLIGTPAGNFPWYTGGTLAPVRYQELVSGLFPAMPKRPMLLTKIGWALANPATATSASYTTFILRVGNAGGSTLTSTWLANLPDQTIRYSRPGIVVSPGTGGSWWEIDLDVPVPYDGKSGLVVDMITAVAHATTFCRASRDDSIQRVLLTGYTGQPTGGAPIPGGCKLKLTFEEQRGPLGRVQGNTIDLEALCLYPGTSTPNSGLLGLEYGPGADPAKPGTMAGNYLWVTGRRDPSNPAGSHSLYQVDLNAPGGPAVAAVHAQPAGTLFSSSGLHDLAYDTNTGTLFGGTDVDASHPGRLYAFDCKALAWVGARDVAVPATALACLRALAFDPVKGKFWAANLSGPIEEIDAATGAVLATIAPAQHGASEIAGLCLFDPDGATPRLWSLGAGSTASGPPALPGSGVVLREHDPGTGLAPTGLMTFADVAVPYAAGAPGGLAGGLAGAFDPVSRQLLLWCLQQADKDSFSTISPIWGFGATCPEGSGRIPLPAMSGDAAYVGNRNWALGLAPNLTSSSAAFLFLGRSDAFWFGIPLPWDLGFLGLPGCAMNVAFDIGLGGTFVTAAGARLALPIPQDPAFRDQDLFFQWLLYDPTTSSGLLTSPGFGARVK